MLKSLIKINLKSIFSNITSSNGKTGILKKILYTVLLIYVLLAATGMSALLFYSVAPSLIEVGLNWLYFSFVGIIVMAINLLGSIFITQSLIYNSKDNDLLLSLPIKSSEILTARSLVVLLFNYVYSALVVIPAAIVYALCSDFTVFGIISYAILSILLPLFTMTITLLFSWIITLLAQRVKNKQIFTTIFTLVFLLAYMYLSFNLQNVISAVILNSQQISLTVKTYLSIFYCYGSAVADNNIFAFLIFAAVCILPFILAIYLLSKNFFKLVASEKNNSGTDKKIVTFKRHTALYTLLKKEFERFISFPTYLLNSSLGVVFLFVVSIMFLIKGEDFLTTFGMVASFEGCNVIIIATILAFLAGMNNTTLASVSLEGTAVYIVKSLPLSYRDFYNSKLLLNLSFGVPSALIASIISCFAIKGEPVDYLIIILFPVSIQLFSAVSGLAINMHKYKFDWTNPAYPVKQSTNVLFGLLLSIFISVAPVILYKFLFANLLNYGIFYFATIIVILSVTLIIYAHILKAGKKYFEMMC